MERVAMFRDSKFLLIFVLVPERHVVFPEQVLAKCIFEDAIKEFLDTIRNKIRGILIDIWDERFTCLCSFYDSLVEIGEKIEIFKFKSLKCKLEVLKVVPPMKSLFRLHGRCSYGEEQSFSGNIGYD